MKSIIRGSGPLTGFVFSALFGALLASACSGDDAQTEAGDCNTGGAKAAGGARANGAGGSISGGAPSNDAGDTGLGGKITKAAGGTFAMVGGAGGEGGDSELGGHASGGKGGASSGGVGGRSSTGGTTSRGGGGGVAGTSGTAGTAGNAGTAGKAAVCGNGVKEAGEECDDGNLIEGDGCNVICKDSHACDACTAQNCTKALVNIDLPAIRQKCFQDTTPAAAGPATGTPRNKLCTDAVKCMRINHSAASWTGFDCSADSQDSYCGYQNPLCVENNDPRGPCVKESEAAAEPPNATGIVAWTQNAFGANGNPLGIANAIVNRCEAAYCMEECGWYTGCLGSPAGSGGSGSGGASGGGGKGNGGGANGGAANGGAGSGGAGSGGAANGGAANGGSGSGGTLGNGGTSGSGGAAKGGAANGGAANGGASSGGSGGGNACAAQYNCATLSGSVGGSTRAALCEAAVSCMKTNACANHSDARSCYCTLFGCGTSAPCVSQLNAAAESTEAATVETRMADPSFAVGLAVKRVTCEIPP